MHHILLPTGSENVSHFPEVRVGVGGRGTYVGEYWGLVEYFCTRGGKFHNIFNGK